MSEGDNINIMMNIIIHVLDNGEDTDDDSGQMSVVLGLWWYLLPRTGLYRVPLPSFISCHLMMMMRIMRIMRIVGL